MCHADMSPHCLCTRSLTTKAASLEAKLGLRQNGSAAKLGPGLNPKGGSQRPPPLHHPGLPVWFTQRLLGEPGCGRAAVPSLESTEVVPTKYTHSRPRAGAGPSTLQEPPPCGGLQALTCWASSSPLLLGPQALGTRPSLAGPLASPLLCGVPHPSRSGDTWLVSRHSGWMSAWHSRAGAGRLP